MPHDLIIGSPEGVAVHSNTGVRLLCLRPRLADFIVKMARGAQVIYPKDIGAILMYADIAPGTKVLEAGTGSGALTMALCRSTGPSGRVVSYEFRSDFHDKARENIEDFFGGVPDWLELRRGDVTEAARHQEVFDRVVLDLPEPRAVLGPLDPVLRTGAIACTFLPTTNQAQESALALRDAGFEEVETFELLHRSWHVTPRSVRPDHRMVAHTGFITTARKSFSGHGAQLGDIVELRYDEEPVRDAIRDP